MGRLLARPRSLREVDLSDLITETNVKEARHTFDGKDQITFFSGTAFTVVPKKRNRDLLVANCGNVAKRMIYGYGASQPPTEVRLGLSDLTIDGITSVVGRVTLHDSSTSYFRVNRYPFKRSAERSGIVSSNGDVCMNGLIATLGGESAKADILDDELLGEIERRYAPVLLPFKAAVD